MCKTKTKGFTLIEMLVVISIIALLIGILLPALGMARRQAARMKNNSRVRNIHQALVGFSAGNRDWYVGMTSRGGMVPNGSATLDSGDGWTVEGRYAIILKNKLVSPEYVISAMDDAATRFPWVPGPAWSDELWGQNYSYAVQEISWEPTGSGGTVSRHYRRQEWANIGGNRAVVIGDRNMGTGFDTDPEGNDRATSVHSDELWQGSTGWNDGHVEFLDQHWEVSTKFDGGPAQHDNETNLGTDNIFEGKYGNRADAMLVHHGYKTSVTGVPDGADGLVEYQPYK